MLERESQCPNWLTRNLVWVSLSLVVIMLIAVSAAVARLRENAWTDARNDVTRTTLAVRFGVERIIENADYAIRTVQSRMLHMDLEGLNLQRRHAMLFAGLSTTAGSILVIDPDGTIAFDSRSATPRQGFANADAIIAQHAAQPGDALSVSVPLRARSDGRLIVVVSRSFYDDSGAFGGIIVVVRDFTEIQGLFDLLRIGQRGVVLLVRADGRLLVRSPNEAIPSERDVSQSPLFRRIRDSRDEFIVGRSSIDGDERLYVARHLTDAPLIVGAGIARAEIDAIWWNPALRVMGVGGVLAFSLWSCPHQTGQAAWVADCAAMNSRGERMRKPL